MPKTPVATAASQPVDNRYLERFLWLSILTAVLTVGIKGVAAWITNSVGLWSDALESTVNLVAAIVAIERSAREGRPVKVDEVSASIREFGESVV